MKVVDRKLRIGSVPQLINEGLGKSKIVLLSANNDVNLYQLTLAKKISKQKYDIAWCLPSKGLKGVWTSNALLDKRIRADWENAQVSSCVSVDAPVISAFSHLDQNLVSIACSDTINRIDFELSYREEDDKLYCRLSLDLTTYSSDSYTTLIREDRRLLHFSRVLQDQGSWFEAYVSGSIAKVPESATLPLYSTWYSYHQDFTRSQLLEECRLSKALGYEVLVVDDGWQTLDDNRGYDYTGDWRPERIKNMPEFARKVHGIGMKLMLWYSVPFCGKKSEAYQKYKGKFLTENHPWAPVFDIRFPDVRAYLTSCYVEAISEWEVDGLKLDFIDDFRIYPETEMEVLGGRDTLSINEGVEKLITEVKEALYRIRPDVLIEFRQRYISPSLRILGNMFRAFDCPFDSLMNRVRTTDVKLLCGTSAVHSDMLTWPSDLPAEEAALQFTSILFSVPQLSIKLSAASEEHLRMISFYTSYWLENRNILLQGRFTAKKPLSNYPILTVNNGEKQIIGVYDDVVLETDPSATNIDIINGKMSKQIAVKLMNGTNWQINTCSCLGEEIANYCIGETQDLNLIEIPPNGLIKLIKV